MTSLSFQALTENLPAGSIELVGNNQVKINFNQLTGDELNLGSSLVEGTVKFLQGLAALTTAVNTTRASGELEAITFASQSIVGTPEHPEYQFTVRVKVDPSNFISNLIDPTV